MSDQTETKKTKKPLVALISAVIVSITPGIYSAWQTAKNEYKAKTAQGRMLTERKVRDHQEKTIQKYVKGLETEIKAIKQSCVTHKDLIDIVLKLRPRKNSYDKAKSLYLLAKINRLRESMLRAKRAKQKILKKPKLHPAQYIRKSLKQIQSK